MNNLTLSTSSPALLHHDSPSRLYLYLPPVSDTHLLTNNNQGLGANQNTFTEV